MPLDDAALDAAQAAWGDTPPLSVAALEQIRPVWLPAYRATTAPLTPEELELPDAA